MKRNRFYILPFAILALVGFTGCNNTQGTSPDTNFASVDTQPSADANQINGAGSGTTYKPASSGGNNYNDPNPSGGGKRNPYGTGKTATGR